MPRNNRKSPHLSLRGRRKAAREQLTKELWNYLKQSGVGSSKNRKELGIEDALEAVFPKNQSTLFEVSPSHARVQRGE